MKHANLIYDVGMHTGGDTEFYLKKGFNVVAFEADPELAESGRRRFSREINAGQLTIVEGAIVDVKNMVNEKGNVFFSKTINIKIGGLSVKIGRKGTIGQAATAV